MPRKKRIAKEPQQPIEETIFRISECEQVINDLENSPAWRILLKDLQLQKQQIDDRWQDLTGNDLEKMRVIKFANNHILALKNAYVEELKQLRVELNTYQNLDKNIIKDYDGETSNLVSED